MTAHVSIERMHEALDGRLTAAESGALEEHLDGCAACRNEHARMSETVAAIRGLPRAARVPENAWAELHRRLEGLPAPGGGAEADIVSLPLPAGARRRVVLSVPQLAAAAVVVSLLSAGSVWIGLRGSTRSGFALPNEARVESPGGAAARAILSQGDRYEEAIDRLEEILEQGRTVLAPSTLLTIEESLRTVDLAIAEVQAALEEDPNSDLLLRLLAAHRRTKLGVLERAASAVQAQA